MPRTVICNLVICANELLNLSFLENSSPGTSLSDSGHWMGSTVQTKKLG